MLLKPRLHKDLVNRLDPSYINQSMSDIATYVSHDVGRQGTRGSRCWPTTVTSHPLTTSFLADQTSVVARHQQSWLLRHSWIQDSVQIYGAFGLSCMLFGIGHDGVDLAVHVMWACRLLMNFKKAFEYLKAHGIKNTYYDAITKADHFMKVIPGQQEPVPYQINAALDDWVTAKKQRLVTIVKTLLLRGRQNFALSGHLDSSKQTEADSSVNYGNFRALLDIRIDAGDYQAHHLAPVPRNTIYTSTNPKWADQHPHPWADPWPCKRVSVLLSDCWWGYCVSQHRNNWA